MKPRGGIDDEMDEDTLLPEICKVSEPSYKKQKPEESDEVNAGITDIPAEEQEIKDFQFT